MSTTGDSSHSPTRGISLAGFLPKSRRRRTKGADTSSTISDGSEISSHRSLRASIGDAMELLKGHHDGSDGSNEDHRTLKKHIKRRRKREQQEADECELEEVERGRHIADRGRLGDNEGSPYMTENRYWDRESNGNGNGDEDGSSLITYESETESSIPPIPPPLLTRSSHTGYLTSSSPLVKTSTVPANSLPRRELDDFPRSSTFPRSTGTLASLESSAVPSTTGNLQTPSDTQPKRSTSPVGKLRDAFNPRRSNSNLNSSPERKAGGGTFGVFQKDGGADSRRGSVASRIGAIFPEKQAGQAVAASPAPTPDKPRIAKLDTTSRPSTPPSNGEPPAPLIVNTPPTPTEPGSARFSAPRDRGVSDPASTTNTNVVVSPSGNMISHRRARTNSVTLGPSKLSNIISAPLTPTLENGPTNPGPNSQTGFFSTVFSAAQNAANTLSNSISNTTLAQNQTRGRSGTQEMREIKEIDDVEVESVGDNKAIPGDATGEKELAVKTLGMGDLSLSHLGISESISNTPTTPRFPEYQESRGRSENVVREETPLQRAATYAGAGDTESAPTVSVEDIQLVAHARSMYEPSVAGDKTPPNGSVFDGKTGIVRSGSVRSAVENSRRKRNSSAATGNTIGAAIAAAHASVAQPSSGPPKLTGFAVASKKRNRDFHQLFRSVPDDDYLIEDYSCALQREILAHGRLYVSEGHLCFSSNIFGWVTTLVMSFDEIVSVEKRSTALLFKNGLMISTLHAKNIFASFTSRDSTYDLIVGIWKLGHPSLRSSLNGVRIEETGGGDKTEKDDGIASQSGGSGSENESEDGNDVYDEDDEDDDGMSFTQTGEGSEPGSVVVDKAVSRKPSAALVAANGTAIDKNKDAGPTSSTVDFPGPATHGPTDCTDQETHYDKVVADEVINAPLGKIYNLVFGPASVAWMSKWLSVDQKCLELQMEDKIGLTNDNKTRTFSYIKPLYASIGPRQTKCIVTEVVDSLDLEKAVSITCTTQTPDVPSGGVFSVKSKYCLSWAEGNSTRLQMNCTIEWTGKSWLKGPIEKGANDGQVSYAKELTAALKAAISSRRVTPAGNTSKGKKKRKGLSSSKGSPGKLDGSADGKSVSKVDDWGLLEPLHDILGPIIDIFKPLLSGNMVYGLLVGLLVAAWFGWGRGSAGLGSGKDMGFFGTPDRIAAYEEIWRREESELWEWLEDRVGMDRLHTTHLGHMADMKAEEAKSIEEKLRDERVSQREIETAIKVTEEKLKALKGVVEKGKKSKKANGSEQP